MAMSLVANPEKIFSSGSDATQKNVLCYEENDKRPNAFYIYFSKFNLFKNVNDLCVTPQGQLRSKINMSLYGLWSVSYL